MNAAFQPGDTVRVLARTPTGHCRTPHYLRGRKGEVLSILGTFPNPEKLAYYEPGEPRVLYEVKFALSEVWGRYDGPAADAVVADIYDHWLGPCRG